MCGQFEVNGDDLVIGNGWLCYDEIQRISRDMGEGRAVRMICTWADAGVSLGIVGENF